MVQSRSGKVAIVLVGQGLNAIISFLALPYLARSLDYDGYGSYGQVILSIDIFRVLFLVGLAAAINIVLAKYKDQISSILKTNIVAVIALGIAGACLTYLLADSLAIWFKNDQLPKLIKIYAWSIPFQLLSTIFSAFNIFFDKIKQTTIAAVILNATRVVLLVVAIQVFQSLELLFYAAVLISAVQAVTHYFIIDKKYRIGGGYNQQLLKMQLAIGLPIALTGIIGFLLKYTDGLMISNMLETKDFAIYRNGAFELPFIGTIFAAIGTILVPEISKLFTNKNFDEIIRIKNKAITSTALIVYPIMIFVMFFHYEIVVTVFSNKYEASAIIFLIFTFLLFIRVNNYQDVFVAAEKTRIVFYANAFCLILNVVLNYFLIEKLGIKGAALSTVISMILLAVILLISSSLILKTSVFKLFSAKKIVFTLVVAGLISFGFYQLYSLYSQIWMLAVYFAVYIAIILFILIKWNIFDTDILKTLLQNSALRNITIVKKIID